MGYPYPRQIGIISAKHIDILDVSCASDISKVKSVDKLKVATMLYDIGNTMLPKELLHKKEPLTEADKVSIKQHPIIAAREILMPISSVVDVLPIIEKHHENWDGTGYPNKLSGEKIPLESQIILICELYVSMRSIKSYKKAYNHKLTIQYMTDQFRVYFDGDIFEHFLRFKDQFEEIYENESHTPNKVEFIKSFIILSISEFIDLISATT